MRANHTRMPIVLAMIAMIAGCGAPAAPEGFSIEVQMINLHRDAIDTLRLTIDPRTTAMPDAAFAQIDRTTYEDGGITVYEETGLLVLELTGDYVRANDVGSDPLRPRVAIEVWSDDDAMRAGPAIRATVVRAGTQIASGSGFLPEWPLDLGGSAQVTVECPAAMVQCSGS
jgi:hypothetical protein